MRIDKPGDTARAAGVEGSAEELRRVMAHFASGVTVVTALDHGIKHAMTATAICSVSLDPPLILVCVGKTSRFHQTVTGADRWCVSILNADQEYLARHFAHRGRDLLTQFDDVPHEAAGESGCPVIGGALAWMECATYARHDGGDHTILVGRVVEASRDPIDGSTPPAPLTYYRGTYS